jgi:hypothetical protein
VSDFITNPIVVGTAIGIPSTILGFLGYGRAKRVDHVAEQAGITTGRSAELNLALAGMDTLIKSLQADNRGLRDEVGRLTQRLNAVVAECDELAKQLRVLRQRYGNGDEAT